MLKNKSKNIKGITLIALVITIIVLLILAGITINMITSQDGILSKTILAKGKMNEAEIEEKIKLAVTKAQINENGLDKNELKDELNKYFGDKYTLTENSDGSCVIEVEGVIYKVDSSGNILNSKYELATSEDGTISDSSGDSLSNYIIYGNSTQNGEPSPENPVEIESVGDKTKNLIDIDSMLNDCLIKNEDGSYTIKKISSGNRMSKTLYVNIPADTYICLSGKVLEYNGTYNYPVQVVCDLEDGSHVTLGIKEEKSWITKYEKEIKAIRIYQEGAMPDGTYAKFKNLQLEIGKEPTEYGPYGKYKIPVNVEGKNLINIDKVGVKSGYYYDSIGNPSNEDERFIKVGSVKCESLTQYSLSSNLKIYTVWFYSGNEAISREEVLGKNNITFTTPENCNALRISLYNTSGIADTSAFEWIQLEKGEKNTLYEEYKEPITTNIYLNEPLRKVGDYADYIDFKNKKVVRNIKEIEFNGSEEWVLGASGTNVINQRYYLQDNSILQNRQGRILSNILKEIYHGGTSIFMKDEQGCNISNGCYIQLKINKKYLTDLNYDTTVAGFKQYLEYLKSNNKSVIINATLSTTSEETIELPNILTGKGTNKVSIETKIQPSKMEINYYKTK